VKLEGKSPPAKVVTGTGADTKVDVGTGPDTWLIRSGERRVPKPLDAGKGGVIVVNVDDGTGGATWGMMPDWNLVTGDRGGDMRDCEKPPSCAAGGVGEGARD